MTRLAEVLAAIDAANAKDPGRDAATGEPAALVYGRRMSDCLARFAPDAADALAIAVRGQHIERWTIPRANYPMDRPGYLRWRNELKDVHARRLAEIMTAAGYGAADIERAQQIVRKERFKVDADAQTLEDVACLVFLEFYAADFAAKHETAKVEDIIAKTWRKMSTKGHAAALALPLAPDVAERVKAALGAR
jgi:hypothetical protein